MDHTNPVARRGHIQKAAQKGPTMTEAVGEHEVLKDEALQIEARREALKNGHDAAANLEPGHYLGVAFSGGGIRSGTFNLGILQGLARVGLLPYVDYLSTVSGGGYIGTWLHGIIKRLGLAPVEQILRRPDCTPHLEEPSKDPIAFLRKYSSYLAPDLGLFSADFWVILVIWFRNTFLNLLMLVPFLALIVLFTFHAGFLRKWIFVDQIADSTWYVSVGVPVLLFFVVYIAGKGVSSVTNPQQLKPGEPARFDRASWAVTCAALMLAAAVVFAWSAHRTQTDWGIEYAWTTLVLSLLFFFLQLLGGFLGCYCKRHKNNSAGVIFLVLFPLVAAAATAALGIVVVHCMASWQNYWCIVAYGPPLVGLIFIVGAGLHIGLMAADFPDAGREWFARVGAFFSIFLLAWAAVFTICVFGPHWISEMPWFARKLGLTATWVLTTAGGVISGISSKTSGKPGDPSKSKTLEIIGQLGPSVFVIGLMVLISYGVTAAIDALPHVPKLPVYGIDYWNGCLGWSETAFLTGVFLVVLFLLPFRININEFSMHYFYKNRLVRCYLGASHQDRRPSLLTGFDSHDDFPLAQLVAQPTVANQCHENDTVSLPKPYHGPYPIICATLNLNTGSDLAKRERHGTSFVFTPLYSGYKPPISEEDKRQQKRRKALEEHGFRRTCEYSLPGHGLDIGTCMGISGAAANPNWGYHTSAAVAFLLTVFDVRLGWWIGNSRLKAPSKKIGPRWALLPLLSELFAQTDQRSKFLNLSDGGHFENLGLYELIRRRCRYIIVGDGEQDRDLTFESLGGAIRKCRIDFGVTIDLNPRPIALKNGFSTTHCVVGKITYPNPHHPVEHGWILYLKSSLTGDEPEDVAQYKSAHTDFPHETTANQFFTESQFESYRRLGLHVVESAFANVTACGCKDPLLTFRHRDQRNWMEHLFRCLEQQWYPPTDIPDTVKSHHAEAYTALLNRLSQDADLKCLDAQVIRPAPVGAEKIERKAFFYCLELIQLMENVWADLHLYQLKNRQNPKNNGWLTIFHFWAKQPIFKETWKHAAYTFNPLFQQFFDSFGSADPAAKETHCGPLPPGE